MGYGGARRRSARKLARPERPVVAFVGDGGFLMTGQELVTAVQEGLPVKVVLGDNGAYGTIAMHQHKRIGPDGLFAVHLQSPDFAAVARAYGVAAFLVERTAEFAEAFAAALAHPGPRPRPRQDGSPGHLGRGPAPGLTTAAAGRPRTSEHH